MDKFISKEDTTIIKAIAIIMMLAHHLWTFPDRIAGGGVKYLFTLFGQSSISYIGSFGKICVSIFFLVGGYGIYISNRNKRFDIVNRIKKLYISYWKVFLIYIPIGFLFFSKQVLYCDNESICTMFNVFSKNELVLNFLGMSSSYNGEWWFLRSYVLVLFTFPIVRAIVDRLSLKTNLLCVVFYSIIITNLLPALGSIEQLGTLNSNFLYSNLILQSAPYSACFAMGVITAKEGLLDRLNTSFKNNKLSNMWFDVLSWVAIIYLRQTCTGDSMDIFYLPILIVTSIDFVRKIDCLRRVLLVLGKQSTNMWLIHSFFCYYFYAVVRIVLVTRWAVPTLIILIVLTYFASVFNDFIWKKISGCKNFLCDQYNRIIKQ